MMKKFSLPCAILVGALASSLFGLLEASRLGETKINDAVNQHKSSKHRPDSGTDHLGWRQKRLKIMQQTFAKDFRKKPLDNPFSRKAIKDNEDHRDLQDEEEQTEEDNERIVIVECSELPLFKCSTCGESLQLEQDRIFVSIAAHYPGSELVSASQRLVNAIFVRLPPSADETAAYNWIRSIDGVTNVSPHGNLEMQVHEPMRARRRVYEAVEYMGGYQAREEFCATGKGIRVGVLDGGVDYTHYYLGGPGTLEAFEAAYGTDPRSDENRDREGLFPTEVVVDGYDFTGEYTNVLLRDDDPIDAFGHGTAVAHALLTVAPGAKLVAVKVCSGGLACPVYSIMRGLEYALDPNGDNNLDDKVDIVNLSLGLSFVSPFYNFVAAALETVFELGVLPVLAAGNSGNVPYIMGGLSGSPNSISVGGTGSPNTIDEGVMAFFSSRGPGIGAMLKPDIVAPANMSLAAAGTGYYRFREIQGTSFSSPLVAAAAALVMERCPECSPFAIKSLLMNNADRGTRYHNNSYALSPVTLSGAGEMDIAKTLEADFWAYSLEDVMASISLGFINADKNLVLQRTIKVINLSDQAQTLRATYAFRNPNNPYADALKVEIDSPTVELPGSCNSEAVVLVTFTIDATRAPPNHMTSTGRAGFDPTNLDIHEFGGHIILTAEETGKDISLPFVSLIRQASDVTAANPVITDLSNEEPTFVNVGLTNNGAGRAQVDAFQLIAVSEDNEESDFGGPVVPNDFRYIGYRVLQVGRPDCTHLLEFAFNTWERQRGRLVEEIFGVEIDLDGDNESDFLLYNTGLGRECFVVSAGSDEPICTGLPPDHGTNSGTTVVRACSENLGLTTFEGQLGVRFEALTFTALGEIINTDSTAESYITIDFPHPRLSAPSYDISPGDSLETLEVDGTRGDSGSVPFGLMLVTNSYRDANNTGASTPATETVLVLLDSYSSQRLPVENTADVLVLPAAQDLTGPDCSWKGPDTVCAGGVVVEEIDEGNGMDTIESPSLVDMIDEDPPILPIGMDLNQREDDDEEPFVALCPPKEVPRAQVQPHPPTPVLAQAPTIMPIVANANPVVSISVTGMGNPDGQGGSLPPASMVVAPSGKDNSSNNAETGTISSTQTMNTNSIASESYTSQASSGLSGFSSGSLLFGFFGMLAMLF